MRSLLTISRHRAPTWCDTWTMDGWGMCGWTRGGSGLFLTPREKGALSEARRPQRWLLQWQPRPPRRPIEGLQSAARRPLFLTRQSLVGVEAVGFPLPLPALPPWLQGLERVLLARSAAGLLPAAPERLRRAAAQLGGRQRHHEHRLPAVAVELAVPAALLVAPLTLRVALADECPPFGALLPVALLPVAPPPPRFPSRPR